MFSRMSVIPNQTNATTGTTLFQPNLPIFNVTWSTMTTAAVATATLSTSILQYVTPTSVIQATICKDDQAGSGNCWLISSAPGISTITYTIGAASSANSQLPLATSIEQY